MTAIVGAVLLREARNVDIVTARALQFKAGPDHEIYGAAHAAASSRARPAACHARTLLRMRQFATFASHCDAIISALRSLAGKWA